MGTGPWWIWLLPVAFAAPWVAGAVWSHLKSPRGADEVVPLSYGEEARRRLTVR